MRSLGANQTGRRLQIGTGFQPLIVNTEELVEELMNESKEKPQEQERAIGGGYEFRKKGKFTVEKVI